MITSILERLLDSSMDYYDNPIKLSEDKNQYLIKMIIPGLKSKDFDIGVDKKTLYLNIDIDINKYNFIDPKILKNNIFLPDNIEEDKIEASYESGILKIIIPKIQRKINKIKIKDS